MKRKAVNLALFNAGWYACARSTSLAGVGVVGLLLIPHFALAPDRRREARTLVAAALFGLVADTLLERVGLVRYAGGPRLTLLVPLVPLWIVALWINFATTLNASLSWLRDKPVPAAVLGALAGPATYALGGSLGAAELSGWTAYAAVAVVYAVGLPLLLRVARHG